LSTKKFIEALALRPWIVKREKDGKTEHLSTYDGSKIVWSKQDYLALRMDEERAKKVAGKVGGVPAKVA
jgi:hypothetical protein